MSRTLPKNLYKRKVTGTSQTYLRPQNLVLSEPTTSTKTLVSISDSPSPLVLYI